MSFKDCPPEWPACTPSNEDLCFAFLTIFFMHVCYLCSANLNTIGQGKTFVQHTTSKEVFLFVDARLGAFT